MSDRITGFMVVLDEDMTEESAKYTLLMLERIKGVIGVKPVVGRGSPDAMLATRVSIKIAEKIMDLARSVLNHPVS